MLESELLLSVGIIFCAVEVDLTIRTFFADN